MELLTTGQMIDNLNIGDEAEFTDCAGAEFKKQKVIRNENGIFWKETGNVFEVSDFISKVKWRIIPHYVSYEVAMKAHKEEKKTIVYHYDGELKYEFRHELETGQFDKLASDNLCLYELLEGKWSVKN